MITNHANDSVDVEEQGRAVSGRGEVGGAVGMRPEVRPAPAAAHCAWASA